MAALIIQIISVANFANELFDNWSRKGQDIKTSLLLGNVSSLSTMKTF